MGKISLRSKKVIEDYIEELKTRDSDNCFLCEGRQVKEYKYWCLYDNDFPYDNIAEDHKMLCTKRHISSRQEMVSEELNELEALYSELDQQGNFDAILENFTKGRSVKDHFHLHLIRYKRD